jgi:hypothetical protein
MFAVGTSVNVSPAFEVSANNFPEIFFDLFLNIA